MLQKQMKYTGTMSFDKQQYAAFNKKIYNDQIG